MKTNSDNPPYLQFEFSSDVNSEWFTQHQLLRLFKCELLWQFLEVISGPLAATCESKAQKKMF